MNDGSPVVRLGCGHYLHQECMSETFNNVLKGGNFCLKHESDFAICCKSPDCAYLLSDYELMKMVVTEDQIVLLTNLVKERNIR